MLSSFKFKIIALIVLVLLCTAAGVMYFTHRDVGQAMLTAEQKSARNVLQLADLNIRAGYDQLITEKVEILGKIKRDMQQTGQLVKTVFSSYETILNDGLLDEVRARAELRSWLESIRFIEGDLILFDRRGEIASSTDKSLIGASVAGLTDLKGRQLHKSMHFDLLHPEGDTGIFFWQKPGQQAGHKYMGYFLPLKSWGWTLAVIVNFEDVEQQSQKQMALIIEALKNTFSKLQVARTGYAFLFNGDKEVLIEPPHQSLGSGITTEDLDWGHSKLLHQIIQTHEQGGDSLRYQGPYTADSNVQIYTSYFKAFDWYYAVVVPVAEIEAPGREVVEQQSIIIGLIFMLSIGAAFILVVRLSRPLNTLASYAKAMPAKNFSSPESESDVIKALADRHDDEVGRLAESFVFMEMAIRATFQQVRKEKENAIEASRAKSEFLATMSHEIRTPMNGVLGMTDLVLETELTKEQRRFMNMIRYSGEGLLEIINDILDFSKIEAGKLQLDNQPLNLKNLLENQVEILRTQAVKKNLTLTLNLPPELDLTVLGDGIRLRQVLTNLVGNAIKFTHSGSVDITAVIFDMSDEMISFQVRVADTGIGISTEHKQVIFDLFSQADSSTTRHFGGTGLGLSISRQLIEMMDGNMDFSSELGKGSTFWFGLQLQRTDQPVAEDINSYASDVVKRLSDTRVLLVEDHPVNQEYAIQALQGCGADVTLACNGVQAIEKISQNHYDLILMDCQMPEMDGYQATAEIRRLEQEGLIAQIPIVALTANAMPGDRQRCLEAGMNEYLPKPFTKAQIASLMSSLLTGGVNETPADYAPPISQQTTRIDDPIDADVIEQLVEMDNSGAFLKKIIDAYLEKSPLDIEQIKSGLFASDPEALRVAAHSFKSSSYNLGALTLAELCKTLEQAGRDKDLSSAKQLIEQIQTSYQAVEQALIEIRDGDHG